MRAAMSTREQRIRNLSKRRARRHDEPRTDAPSWEYDGRPPSSWLPCGAASGHEQGGAETAGRDVDDGSNNKSRTLRGCVPVWWVQNLVSEVVYVWKMYSKAPLVHTPCSPPTQGFVYKTPHDGGGVYTIESLKKTPFQVMRIASRITTKQYGLKEDDGTQLVQALIISRIAYAASCLPLTPKEKDQLDVLLRKAHKQALGLPPGIATIKLEALGAHNTVREIVGAHLTSQRERLVLTPTVKKLLARLDYPTQGRGYEKSIYLTPTSGSMSR
ncbi:hypothetical protein HPB49_020747 [Dermacentor silvarum]|uniref:Uncharacterized protein n=1 Tax=Dermacentor silvarum TaxID=543639 RepID=A0ACB8C5C6_DERSI|nr:hypothetical protein HPB49_020747 [Dermacentor silvarum]